MTRFVLKIAALCILLWVVLPLLIANTIAPLQIRATSELALFWYLAALLVTGALCFTFGYRQRTEKRLRYWLANVFLLFVFWLFLPALSPNTTARSAPIMIESVKPVALLWYEVALFGSLIVTVDIGRRVRTFNDAARQRDLILGIVRDQLLEGIAVFTPQLQPRYSNVSSSRYLLDEGQALRPEVQRLIQRAQSAQRLTSQSLSLNEDERIKIQVTPLPDGSLSVIARPLQNDAAPTVFYDRFIRRIVHDMRNPLAAIIAHASNLSSLEDGRMDSTNWKNTIQIIENEAQRLTRLVDSMLFDARLSYVPLDMQQLDLMDVIEEVYFQHDERAIREGKRIEMEMPLTNAPLEADRDLLVRALSNLLDNSLKYTAHGTVVRIHLEMDDANYRLSVSDNGEGIPPDFLPDRIFEPLVRVRASDGGGGSGLGLSIVRKIVEMHHGSIGIESKLGEGTTITIGLPK
jgi:signal transduction histidine kinase